MLIALAATPVISRLFDPADFGVAALFIATMTVTASMLALAYERGVLFPKQESKAARILVLALSISVACTLLVYIVIGICVLIWPDIAEFSGMGNFFWFFPLGALFLSLRGTLVALCIRREDFSSIASADVGAAVISASTRILWGLFLASSVVGLVFGHLLGIAIAVLICGVRCMQWLRNTVEPANLVGMQAVAIEYKDYPLFRAPAKIAFSAARRLPIIALGILFPAEIVGYYAMANRAAELPLQAASTSVSNVLLRKTMGLRQIEQPMGKSLMKVVMVLIVTGLPIFSLMFFFGQEILSWFLGARWSSAGSIVQILAPYLFTLWVGSFAPTVFETLRLNKLRLKLHVGNLLVRCGTFAFCGVAGLGVTDTLWIFVVISSAYQVFIYAIAARATARYDAELIRTRAGVNDMNIGLP